ncbi:MAG: aminopeptidase P family protein [Rhodobacteraceae bacterium]|nr:aminopeptidase P family protein [Paracoccaceae bacterium]
MFQNFTVTTSPDAGPARLAKLRETLREEQVDGFLIPRADAHFGENVAPSSERLAWLTGFTGSAGYCAALLDTAGVFIDGRYTLQVRSQIDLDSFTPLSVPAVELSDWLIEALPQGGTIAYDPWLHSFDEIEKLETALVDHNITLRKTDNLIDRIWTDRPEPPKGKIHPHAMEFAGEASESKRQKIGAELAKKDLTAAVLTLPDSIAWVLNIRGADISNTPVALCFAILHANGNFDLFVDLDKCDGALRAHLGADVTLHPEADFPENLTALTGKTAVDRDTAPIAISDLLQTPVWEADPCILPKACKNPTEIAGTRTAHIRDAAAMAEFLCWLESAAPSGTLTEIDVVQKLETFRRNTNALKDISFETICGSGPNGAIVHYRVDENSNRMIQTGETLLVDSGGQYEDGTTDITRTIAVGEVPIETKRANTLVLKGMIAITRSRWPVGLSGRDLDGFARIALWQAGMDYDHGTGHGVGAYLSVHEDPQSISGRPTPPLETGMIVSNEPGHYKEGVYGIRIENLLVITPPTIPEGGDRKMHGFETLTFVPIDRHLILAQMLTADERNWLNAYHAEVFEKINALVTPDTRAWLESACAPI